MVTLQTCKKGKYQLKSPEQASLLSLSLVYFYPFLRQAEFILHGYYKGCDTFLFLLHSCTRDGSVFKELVSQPLKT